MGELLIKPYEISVWEERLAQNGERLEEKKIAVIGSDTMTGMNKVYEPVFTKRVNGEKTLTFSLKYKYFDPYSGADGVINPFAALLSNERKVKLKYDDKWYEFIVKDHSESSDGLTWTYTCSDAFVLELSKIGYNITFDSELNNNQGTAAELVQETIKDTDWKFGAASPGPQYVEEPVYKARLESKTGISIINTKSGDSTPIPAANSDIYLFYSYVKNQDGKNVQFIIRDDNRKYTIDSKNVITDVNFRITTDLIFNNNGFYTIDSSGNPKTLIISITDIENRWHVNRLAYSQLNTYDPVMQHTVDRFRIGNKEVYRYTDSSYSTSNIVMNYITNGENFNALEDGTLQGWNPYVESSGTVQKLELVTNPEVKTGAELVDLASITKIEGFLKTHFVGALNSSYQNAIYNSGITDNASLLGSISAGDKFVFRWRASKGNFTTKANNFGILIAQYTQDEPTFGYYYKHIDKNNIYLNIHGTPQILNSKITGGEIANNNSQYIINDVPVTPSSRFIYEDKNTKKLYRWDVVQDSEEDKNIFVETTESAGLPYYYLTGTAQKTLTNAVLTDPSVNIGIFIYTTGSSAAGDYYIQDIQLTNYIEGDDGKPLLVGSAPTTTVSPVEYYYLKPEKGAVAEEVETYSTPEELKKALNTQSSLVPLYSSDKYLSISENHSNCFNILQSIAETFECWVDLVIEHDDTGAVTFDEDGKPNKFVYLREYVGHDNWAGFKYGINVQSIERTINSDEIVTKLIVDDSQSDYVDSGIVSIRYAPSNQSGENFILNFDYYYSQGLLDRETVEASKNAFLEEVSTINKNLQDKEKEREKLEADITNLGSKKNVYNALVEEAKTKKNEALAEFESLKGESYDKYRQTHPTLEPSKQLTEDETLADILGRIYNYTAVINNYAGLATKMTSEYEAAEAKLEPVETLIEQYIEQKDEKIKEFNNKYRRYIQEGTWNSTDYIDPELYYLDALQVSNTSAQPVVSYTINVVEISQLEGFEGYLFDAGDKTYIEDTEFFGWNATNIGTEQNPDYVLQPAREEVIVSEVEWHLDEPDQNTLTVQNYKSRFEDMFQRISAAVQTVQYNEATYAKISTLMDANGTLNQNILLNAMNNIAGKEYALTSDGSIFINGDQITIQNLTNRSNVVILNSEGLRVSSDGGTTWATAIDGQGINIGTVYTGMLNTNQVVIGSKDNPSFRWDKSGISAYKSIEQSQATRNLLRAGAEDEEEVEDTGYDLQTFVRYDQYGLYGIKNNGTFVASSIEDIKNKAHFAITWDGFFIKNSYEGGGRVEITSDNDFRVLNDPSKQGNFNEKIKIGALEWGEGITSPTAAGATKLPTLYGIRIKNDDGTEVFKTGDDGNIEITGTLNATAGNFSGLVNVGPENQDHIIIDGRSVGNSPSIASSNYQDGAGYGWMINKDGDAVFNNITARGAIKTAVFEYAEIEAVGGLFVFRPSSTIKSVRISGDDLIVKVEKPFLFETIKYTEIENPSGNPKSQGWYEQGKYGYIKSEDTTIDSEKTYFSREDLYHSWCKISNYNNEGAEADVSSILSNNGLSHVYEISDISNGEITLKDAAPFVEDVRQEGQTQADVLKELEGGALIDFGREADTSGYDEGRHNYGVGINSSDNTVNLPERAISLFETVIHPEKNIKVSYDYRGILGTLPVMEYTGENPKVNPLYHNYMEKTQGIYTDNMYIGDKNQYLAFYTDNNGDKHLKISARDMVFGYDEETGEEITWEQKIDEATQGSDAAQVVLTSTIGEQLVDGIGQGAVYARLYIGKQEDDPLKTFVFTTTPPDSGNYYYHLNTINKTCILKKKVNGTWVDAPSEDQSKYNYVWTFRDESGQPITYNGQSSITGKAIYMDGDIVNNKIIIQCDVSDNS